MPPQSPNFPCNIDLTKHRDIPCECAHPPLQCFAADFPSLPTNPPEDIRNGDTYVIEDTLLPYFYWNGTWYPFCNPGTVGDMDWFKEGTVGPDYNLYLITDKAYHNAPIAVDRTSARGVSSLDVGGQLVADGIETLVSDVPISGGGVRMMWLPETGSFRAGSVSGTQWDNASVGDRSLAIGRNVIASGDNSAAIGSGNSATNDNSFIHGGDGFSTGVGSRCGGISNVASDVSAEVIGFQNVASGIQSFCGGRDSVAGADRSFVFGALSSSFATDQSTIIGDHLELSPTAGRTFLVGHNWFPEPPGPSNFIYNQWGSFIVHRLRPFMHVPDTAPVDADITVSHMSFWIDEAANNLVFRVRYSGGGYKTGTVALV